MTRLLHLSDTHVSAHGTDADGVDAEGSLRRMLADAALVPDLDAVVVSGDVADDGSAEGCRRVRELVGAFAAERGIPHLYCTGNHDRRVGFRAALGTGHLDPDGTDRGRQLGNASGCSAVSSLDGLRVVTLDSLVEGATEGRLETAQLDDLATELATRAPRGTVLMLHHPPLQVPSLPYVSRVALQDVEGLAAVVRGSDVRAVLAGHLHFTLSGSCGAAPVWVSPGIVTRIDTTASPARVRGVLGAGASVVELADEESPTCHVLHARDPRAGEQVYDDPAPAGS